MVKPEWSDPSDLLHPLRSRIFDFVNEHANGDSFELAGQEPFNVIKYNNSGDEYR
jgi:hypothetical protein